MKFIYRKGGFNPTMVRLLLTETRPQGATTAVFQSHNGAIAARVQSVVQSGRISLFQSHNGAIAAVIETTRPIHNGWFQSHNGAIAAKLKSQSLLPSKFGFNPTMVRLLRR